MIHEQPDFTLSNLGSIFLLYPHTGAGEEWIEENMPEDVTIHSDGSIVIEHRYISQIVDGMRDEGLTVI